MKKEYRKGNRIIRIVPYKGQYEVICVKPYNIKTYYTDRPKSLLLRFMLKNFLKLEQATVNSIMEDN